MAERYALSRIQREHLEPVWSRLEIPTERIAASLGVSRQALQQRAKRLGLPSRSGNMEPKKLYRDNETFRRMYLAGVSTREMAEVMGFANCSGVCMRARRLGLPYRITPGEAPGAYRAPITLAEFRESELARLMQGAP